MLRSTAFVFFSSFVLLLLLLLVPTHQSLLPLSDPFPDPFRILEHVPLELERDESVAFFAPARVDWKETHDGHVISVDVPGLKREEVKVEVEEENRVLRVTGERKRENEEKAGDHWHRTERSYGKFWRQFKLPGDVDLDSVDAKLEDGVLTLTFSKLSPDKVKGPRVVDIAGGEEPAKKLYNKKEEL